MQGSKQTALGQHLSEAKAWGQQQRYNRRAEVAAACPGGTSVECGASGDASVTSTARRIH